MERASQPVTPSTDPVTAAYAGLRLDHRPSATTKLIGELFGRQRFHHLFLGRLPPCRRRGRNTLASFCVSQLSNDFCRFVARELATGLTLGEPHGAACVAEANVSGLLEEAQQLTYLCCRGRWTRLLTKCHTCILAYMADTEDQLPLNIS